MYVQFNTGEFDLLNIGLNYKVQHNANNTKQQLNQITEVKIVVQNTDTNYQVLLKHNIRKQIKPKTN